MTQFSKKPWNGARKPENTSGWSSQPAISKRCSCFVNVICWRAVYPQEVPPHFFTLRGLSEDPNLSMFSGSSRLEQGQDWGRSFKSFTEAITKGSFRNRSELTGKKQPKTVGREDFFESFSGFWSMVCFACPVPFQNTMDVAGISTQLPPRHLLSLAAESRDMSGLAECRGKLLFRSPSCYDDFVI